MSAPSVLSAPMPGSTPLSRAALASYYANRPLSGPEHRRGAGAALLVSSAAAATGAVTAGVDGAFAGLTLAGALRNARRAATLWTSSDALERHEAGKSGMLALIEVGVATFFIHRILKS